tara:strand:+ start:276 stop:617 length:342 start_codon:yes stop_codon:yes gene_type:complete
MYFAQIDNSNNVIKVIVCDSKQWCENNIGGTWVQTYKDNVNKNYAGINMIYHPDKDNFSIIQPYPSWILNDACIWQAPIDTPSDNLNENEYYDWNESTLSWDKLTFDIPTEEE